MKRRILLLITTFVMTGLIPLLATGCSDTKEATSNYQNVTPAEAFELIRENEGNNSFVILDVRTPAEFDSGHLPGAINIDVESGHFTDEIAGLYKDNTYLVYCRSGRRSVDTSEIMVEQGFSAVYNMTSGINGWKSNGFPVVQ